jgi:hypothetical protein
VLGKPMTAQEFLANPQAQDAVFKAKFGQYTQQYGSPQAASRAWFAGPNGMNNPNARDVNGVTVAQYEGKFNQGYGQQQPTPPSPGGIDPTTRAAIAAMAAKDPKKALEMIVAAQAGLKKEGAWEPLSDQNARMFLGTGYDENKAYQRNTQTGKIELLGERKKLDAYEPIPTEEAQKLLGQGFDPNKAYQRNKATGKIEPIGGSLVNIENKGQTEFAKEMGKLDAKRLNDIQTAEATMNEMASKIGFAVSQLGETYTGPGGEAALALNKVLGAAGFEEAGKKANAASAAHAVISQMKPHMRAAGSGASSDRDMDMFAASLPSLANLPGGNKIIAQYFQKLADRATAIRELAEEHSKGGTVPLTGTGFADAVKKLGPLFSEDERKFLQESGKAKPASNRPPLDSFSVRDGKFQRNRPPLESFGGAR